MKEERKEILTLKPETWVTQFGVVFNTQIFKLIFTYIRFLYYDAASPFTDV